MRTHTATVLPFPGRDEQADQAGARPRVRLEPTRRGRLLLTGVAFLLGLAVAAIALLVLDLPAALAGTATEPAAVVTVEAGDTLWEYAAEHAPEGMSETEFVEEVRSLNHLPTGRITAGQQIELPVAEVAAR
jgi:hypothetical protein